MATRVVWTLPARQDVKEIGEYIAQDSRWVAQSVVKRITSATRNLRLLPRMGRIVPELDDEDVRELIVFSYRIIYRASRKRVTVWAVIHGARQLLGALQGRKF